jgi:hypothetical protein
LSSAPPATPAAPRLARITTLIVRDIDEIGPDGGPIGEGRRDYAWSVFAVVLPIADAASRKIDTVPPNFLPNEANRADVWDCMSEPAKVEWRRRATQ